MKTCSFLLVSLLVACGDDGGAATSGGGGDGGGGGAGGAGSTGGPGSVAASSSVSTSDGAATTGATSASSSASSTASSTASGSSSSGAGGECPGLAGAGGAPATIEDAWLGYCERLHVLEGCVECELQPCEEHADVIAAGYENCPEEAIAYFLCIQDIVGNTSPADCACGVEIMECPVAPGACGAEQDALDACNDA